MWSKINYTSPQGLLKAVPALVTYWYEISRTGNIDNSIIATVNAETGEVHLFKCQITTLLLNDLAELTTILVEKQAR